MNCKIEWRWKCTSLNIWASFDEGTVMAKTRAGARRKAIKALSKSVKKCNRRLKKIGMTISVDLQNLEIEKI